MSQPKLASNFIVLDTKQAATEIPVTPGIYEELDAKFDQFKGCLLIAEYTFSSDWSSWEMHPNGDETLYLISGDATLLLYSGGVESQIEFNVPGSFVIIPKGTWHTALVKNNCTILFITPGEGTMNGADPRHSQN
ncbi:cupin domain-containing protein [Undibacterium flavidum]|uniref:Cupin n=1 Tax=Undibacterium flavidum TaxID=2762297 RepID=A0ABR6YFL7_9BURK|nr:cupin [Undibacterium flavidum]MBC3875370.1 cupin [Undibacterium flavidum]